MLQDETGLVMGVKASWSCILIRNAQLVSSTFREIDCLVNAFIARTIAGTKKISPLTAIVKMISASGLRQYQKPTEQLPKMHKTSAHRFALTDCDRKRSALPAFERMA